MHRRFCPQGISSLFSPRTIFALALGCVTVAASADACFAMAAPTNQVTKAVQAQGNNASAEAAVVLDSLVKQLASGSTGNADMDTVITSLNSLSTDAERAKAAEETTPLLSGGQTQAILSVVEGTSQMVLAHTGEARGASESGLSSGDEASKDMGYRVWAKVYGSRADQDSSNGAAGFEALSAGLVAGVDTNVSDGNVAGLALGVSHTDIKGHGGASNKAEVYGYQGIAYLSHALDKRTTLDLQGDLGLHNVRGRRDITFGTLDRTAESDYWTTSLHLGADLSRDYKVLPDLTLSPYVSLDYSWLHAFAYDETGAASLNLEVDSDDTASLAPGLGVAGRYALSAATALTAHAGLAYDLLAEQSSITACYAGGGGDFTTEGVDPEPLMGLAGLGLTTALLDDVDLNLNYDIEAREGFTNQTLAAKVSWAF